MIASLYRKYVSKKIRDKIYKAFLGYVLLFFRKLPENLKAKTIYLLHWFLPDTIPNQLYTFMGKHGLTYHPYEFALEYKNTAIDCFFDEQLHLFCIMHKGKKLYFPDNFKKEKIITMYKSLIVEQDLRSPHQYLKNLNRLAGKTLLDIGSAEGILSLDAIEIVSHVYLFECESHWIKALNATFNPWKDKVTIIPKYVSDINDENNITIDHFLEGKKNNNLFLKMDIEGFELQALNGAKNTLKEARDLDYAICTYHRKNDAVVINNLFSAYNFESEFTDGFLYYDRDFRKAIIRRKVE